MFAPKEDKTSDVQLGVSYRRRVHGREVLLTSVPKDEVLSTGLVSEPGGYGSSLFFRSERHRHSNS